MNGEPVEEGDADDADAAQDRDRAAFTRDEAAVRRDAQAEQRDIDTDREDSERGRSGSTRRAYRDAAGQDRESAADDRRAAANDRKAAADDREDAARRIRTLVLDDLTGFYQRGAGLIEIEREVVKSHRTGEPFTLAFVDVDGLKLVNDTYGHRAGDRLIVRVADAIRSLLREYDVVARYGGDEFVCGLLGLEEATARQRFAGLNAILARSGTGTISFGLAQLRLGDTVQRLIDRADHGMYQAKARTRNGDQGQ